MRKLVFLLAIVSLIFISSCKKDDVNLLDDCNCGFIVAESGDHNHQYRFEVLNVCSEEIKWFNVTLEEHNTYIVMDYYCPPGVEPW